MTKYILSVTYTPGQVLATSTFHGPTSSPTDVLQYPDEIDVIFPQNPKLGNCSLIVGELRKDINASPFLDLPSPIDLIKTGFRLPIGKAAGLWGYMIAFSVIENDVSTFYCLPDPELQVGSI